MTGRRPTTSTPLWVKIFAVLAAVVLSMFIVMLLSGGQHGPGRHTRGSHRQPPSGQTP